MSNSSGQSWSSDSNAPRLPFWLYTGEKEHFAGCVIAAVFHGISIALFFQCVSALLDPVYGTKKAIKWGLVTHTVAMFSVLTISCTLKRNLFLISYIDNREFSGAGPEAPSGPLEYPAFAHLEATAFVPSLILFRFDQWLADGLLLYRCYVIYSADYWATAIPGLMYLASIATGVSPLYHRDDASYAFDISYYSISLSLNILLTLMIIVRLVLHSRNIRNAVGASSGPSGLYTAVVVMLVESSALYTFAFLLYLVPTAALSTVAYIFADLGEIQVIATFLIVLRVANRSALTSEAVASGDLGSIHFRSGGGSTGGGETLPDPGHSMSHMEMNGETSGELDVGVETVSRGT